MAQVRTRDARRLARRFGLVGWGAVALVVVLAAAVAMGLALDGGPAVTVERAEQVAEPDGEAADEAGAAEKDVTLVVHVDGAVAAPGVYELEGEGRVADAVEAAGGLVEGADTSALNLAALVSDGEKVHVPREGEAATSATGAPAQAQPGLVNLNTADVAQLDELPGVGEATARAIVEDREANGPFTTPEDLMRVSGIGEKKYAKLEDLICV